MAIGPYSWLVTHALALTTAALAATAAAALLAPEERGTAAGRARMALFILLAGLVGFALTSRQAERATDATTGRAFEAYTQGLIAARSLEASRWSSQWAITASQAKPRRRGGKASADPVAALRARALSSYAQAIHRAPGSALFRRQYAILLADAGRREEALRQFRLLPPGAARSPTGARPAASSQRPDGGQPAAEYALWQQLYGPRPPQPAELPALRARLRRLDLGWFENLVLESTYRRMGLPRQAEAAAARAGRGATLLNAALAVLFLMMLGAGLLGLTILAMLLARWRGGRIKRAAAELHAGVAPLLEAFILYLFLAVSPVFFPAIGRVVRGLSPEHAVAVTVTLLLGSDLLSLFAVVYLWSRLRVLRLSLAEVGLHPRDLGRNMLFGLGGYAASLPLVYGAGVLANWLGHRYFPQVAPPFHPIEALTLVGRDTGIRLALLLIVAVGAPVLEEIFFRGLLYGALRRRFGVGWGILMSSALFASLHPQLPLGFLPIFVLGAVLAGLYEWRQSLIPGMTLHALNNGVIWIFLNLLFPPH